MTLDTGLGDPAWLPHPVRIIGWAIANGDQRLHGGSPQNDLIGGAMPSIAVITAARLATCSTIAIVQISSLYAGAAVATLIAWTTLAIRSLDDATREVELFLSSGNKGAARCAIRALVGRDPETLDPPGLVRASIESIAENLSDGFVAPLFFLIVAGPAGALAYKAINTLDSMIGYRGQVKSNATF